jgi:hypothetical protein
MPKQYQTKVHFAGMCLFVTDGISAQVRLPNPLLVKAASHDPVLVIADHKQLEGTPDRSITIPGTSDEFGIWSLAGRSLSFEAEYADQKLRLDLSIVPEGWEPVDPSKDSEWSSLKALANVGEMGQTDELVAGAAAEVTGPIIPISFGSVTALPPPEMKRRSARLNFTEDFTKPALAGTARAMADRIEWILPVTSSITTIKLTGKNPTTIKLGSDLQLPIMISNVAAGACAPGNEDHFDVYFEQIQHKRRPTLFLKVPGAGDPPHYPEICRPAFIQVKKL